MACGDSKLDRRRVATVSPLPRAGEEVTMEGGMAFRGDGDERMSEMDHVLLKVFSLGVEVELSCLNSVSISKSGCCCEVDFSGVAVAIAAAAASASILD